MKYISKFEGLILFGVILLAIKFFIYGTGYVVSPMGSLMQLIAFSMMVYGVICSVAVECVYHTLRYAPQPRVDVSKETMMRILEDKNVVKGLKAIVKGVTVKPCGKCEKKK